MRLATALLLAASGTGFQLARVKREVLAHLQLHSGDLRQEPGCREVVVRRVRLHLAQMSHLALEMADPLQGSVELLIVGNHAASPGMTSTMPLRPPPRLTCHNSIAACSPGQAARCRTQNTLAPKFACAAAWSKSS